MLDTDRTGRGAGARFAKSPGARPRVRPLAGALALAIAATAGAGPDEARADGEGDGVLARIAVDGVIRAGTRANAGEFAQLDESGVFVGFSVDLLEEIRMATEAELGRDVTLDLVEVTPLDRLERVASGDLDIVCGITTPTREREELVDFSLPFFRDGTRIMTIRERASRITEVVNLEIGVVADTTTVQVMEDRLPQVKTRVYDNMNDAMAAFEAGEVAGLANVGTVLLSTAERIKLDKSVVLLPRTASLATESLACVLPENDSDWRDLVNGTLVDAYEGIDGHNSRYEQIYDRWFGREGMFFYPLDRATRAYLTDLPIWVK